VLAQAATCAAGHVQPRLRRELQTSDNEEGSSAFRGVVFQPVFLFLIVVLVGYIIRYFVSDTYRHEVWQKLGRPTTGLCALEYFHGRPAVGAIPTAVASGRGARDQFGRPRRPSVEVAREYGVDAIAVLPPNTIEISPVQLPVASTMESRPNLQGRTAVVSASLVRAGAETVHAHAQVQVADADVMADGPTVQAEAVPTVAQISSADVENGRDSRGPVAQASLIDVGVTLPRAHASTSI
jgi:hypothetical protein